MCDLSDDCGDQSDEAEALCEGRNGEGDDESYFQVTFEETEENFFHNDPNQASNWIRGAGKDIPDQLLKARAPAFDHTHFTDQGHYMLLQMNNQFSSRNTIKSTLVSQLMEPPIEANETCRIRFYFHFTNEIGLNIKFYLAVR